jgi:hypothetical protein
MTSVKSSVQSERETSAKAQKANYGEKMKQKKLARSKQSKTRR